MVSLQGLADEILPVSGFDARYLPSGHLVFGQGDRLMVAPFDLDRRQLTGDPFPVLESLAMQSTFGIVHAAFADDGTAAFVPGNDLARGRLAWVDRQANEGVFDMPELLYGTFDIDPTDRRFAIDVSDVKRYIQIWDMDGGSRDLATSESAQSAIWSPDGTALAFLTKAPSGDTTRTIVQDLQSGAVRELASGKRPDLPDSWVQSGRISLTRYWPNEILVMDAASPSDPPSVQAKDDGTGRSVTVWGSALSPDGTWIAYGSDEGTGRFQIWIKEVDGEARRQVSTDGGLEPVWCRQCDELFYRRGNQILASRITFEPQIEVGVPRVVFEAPEFVDTPGVSFRVSSDGERLYYVRRTKVPVRDRIHIIHNWFSELSP